MHEIILPLSCEFLVQCKCCHYRNVDLQSVPSLEQDLKLVENVLMSSSRNSHIMLNNDEFITNHKPCGEGKTTHKDDCGWFSSSSSLTLLDHLNDRMPGLETPDRTPHGQQLDIWQNWGSELELASPEISHNRTSQSNQGTSLHAFSIFSHRLLAILLIQ